LAQLTTDFDQRFRQGDTPWEDPSPWHDLGDLVGRFVSPGASVLDVGCGLGTNALHLATLGYVVTGIDVSPVAIAGAESRRDAADVSCELRVADFLSVDCGVFDAVFDRGCLHGFADRESRLSFAAAVARALPPGGLWFDISGSADNDESPEVVRQSALPRLSLADIAAAAEPLFDVVELRQDVFGCTPDTDFRAWVGVFRRRVVSEVQA
jgi:methyl halide transferase